MKRVIKSATAIELSESEAIEYIRTLLPELDEYAAEAALQYADDYKKSSIKRISKHIIYSPYYQDIEDLEEEYGDSLAVVEDVKDLTEDGSGEGQIIIIDNKNKKSKNTYKDVKDEYNRTMYDVIRKQLDRNNGRSYVLDDAINSVINDTKWNLDHAWWYLFEYTLPLYADDFNVDIEESKKDLTKHKKELMNEMKRLEKAYLSGEITE